MAPLMVPAPCEASLWGVYHKFGRPFVHALLAWLRLVTGPSVPSEPKWFSFVQIYVACVGATGMRPPLLRTTTRQWYSVDHDAVLSLREVPLSRRVSWFQQQLREIIKAAGGTMVAKQLSPTSESLQVRLSSTFTRLAEATFLQAEHRLHQELGAACCRHDSRWKGLRL